MSALRGQPNGLGRRFAIVVSRFNAQITERLLSGARACLLQHGVQEKSIDVVSVPGAWELPLAAQAAARGGYSAIIALGCVIRGDTPHFDYVAGAAAHGLERVSLQAAIPVAFGVLTTDTTEQALARAGGRDGNKGWDAALVALEMADLLSGWPVHAPTP
ncbi:MAG: 6,7-dimethyl-8-ribityllumazine synthase [Longimicrobiales bacterium]